LTKATVLTDRFDRALLYATHVHGGQVRKGTNTPYVAHLLAVAATVLEYGGDEDLAIAAGPSPSSGRLEVGPPAASARRSA
jgi:(p)ppGpp synthase/HD superfamily hydrolase